MTMDLRKTMPVVDCGLYLDGVRQPGDYGYAEALERAKEDPKGFVWLGVLEPTKGQMDQLAEVFDLHPLAVEDAVLAHQRPKLERYGENAFMVLKTARYVEHPELTSTSEVIETGEVMMFIGKHFILTVRHGDACHLTDVRSSVDSGNVELLGEGPWGVFHAICDNIVDRYLEVAAALEQDVDEVEADVFGENPTDVRRIYHLKREMMELRRAVVPLVRPLQMLMSDRSGKVPLEIRRYIRDIDDHLQRVTEMIAGFDDLLSSALQADVSRVGMQQNNDMRKISALVGLAAIPTMIAGIYGMNFDFMPELKWPIGYPLALLLMVVTCGLFYRFLRKSGWL